MFYFYVTLYITRNLKLVWQALKFIEQKLRNILINIALSVISF